MEVFDEDSVNTLIAEDKAYRRWEREMKNRILAIHDYVKKQTLWKQHFGEARTQDDSYLSGNVF